MLVRFVHNRFNLSSFTPAPLKDSDGAQECLNTPISNVVWYGQGWAQIHTGEIERKRVTHDKIDLFRKLWQRFQGWQSTEKRELVDWEGLLRNCSLMLCLRFQVNMRTMKAMVLNEGYCEVKESSTNQCLLSRFKCGECWGYWGGSQGDVWTHLLLCWGEFFIASEYLASSNFFSLACQVHFHYVSGAEWRKRGGSGRPEASYCLAKHFHSGRSSWPRSGCHHQPITLWASVRSGNVIENHSCHHVLMRCFWGLLFLKLSPSLWILPK